MADIITLDLRRISGKGIISGASFRVPPLADASVRFGSCAAGEVRSTGFFGCQARSFCGVTERLRGRQALQEGDAAQQEAALRQLLEALKQRQEAEQQLRQAEEVRAGRMACGASTACHAD